VTKRTNISDHLLFIAAITGTGGEVGEPDVLVAIDGPIDERSRCVHYGCEVGREKEGICLQKVEWWRLAIDHGRWAGHGHVMHGTVLGRLPVNLIYHGIPDFAFDGCNARVHSVSL